ncbi:hypothetical protein BJY00DRAFT_314264 [Aspergillus carlsbadensis]|nr:hypothetical protein BJY00DRAFT_314264 [Aspergillus carlsbadensis]
MVKNAKTVHPVVQAAPAEGSCSVATKAKNKRKAKTALDNPRTTPPPKAEKPSAESPGEVSDPAAAACSEDIVPTANSPPTAEVTASGDEDASIMELVHSGHWESETISHRDRACTARGFVSPVYPDSGPRRIRLISSGHMASEGALESIFIVLKVECIDYQITIENPYNERDGKHTIAHKFIDLCVQERRYDLISLTMPLLKPVCPRYPPPDNLGSFLQRAVTYLRLVPATASLEPSPNLEPVRDIDWEYRVWKLSEVKHFRWNTATSQIYEVDIDGETLVYKMPQSHEDLLRETSLLLHCAKANIRAPRFKGLIGIDTKWGGFLMTKIPTLFRLSEYPPDSSYNDRQRWYDQISEAVRTLHQGDKVWGDAKPDNVLINTDGNACVIDFEGGCTPEWIGDELANTKAGDLQALERIRKFLNLDR